MTAPAAAPTIDELVALYPALAGMDPAEAAAVLQAQARWLKVPAGTVLFSEGEPCSGFPLVLKGAVRVARGSPGGRSLALYSVGPGEVCVASTACLVGSAPLAAHGVAEVDTELLHLSPAAFTRWVSHEPFRRFVFGIFAERLCDLMELAEAVAFQRLDQRLAGALLGQGATVHATHQALADALGTVREIVTRLLRRFELAGWVALGRERIELLDGKALRALAEGSGTLPP
jgi:CRP/FNR family transcriptional regulator, anaerobic regulatory protein